MNDTPLWTPSPERAAASHMTLYMKWLEARHGLRFDSYDALWRWSVDCVEDFWVSIWDYFDVLAREPYTHVLDSRKMPGARWFAGARLNVVEHALRWHTGEEGERAAVIGSSELRPVQHLSWNELRRQVASVAHALRELGIEKGDRVAAYLPNVPEAVVAFCACAAIGAIWSGCSPRMSTSTVVDRLRQIAPKLLIVVDGYRSGAKDVDCREAMGQLRSLPGVQQVVSLPYLFADRAPAGTIPWKRLVDHHAPLVFAPLSFDHPLWIVYASGSEEKPAPIVHGHGGILLEQLKSHGLARGLGENDRFMGCATTGCANWNFQLAALLVGSTICLHDGDPDYPDLGVLWRLIAGQRLTAFSASPAFHMRCMEANIEHSRAGDLSALRLLVSSGSLTPQTHEWIRAQLGPGVVIYSGASAIDIASDFAGGCDLLPQFAHELPCRNLGVAAHAYDRAGNDLVGQIGQLVITLPMPSMPLYFWGDADGRRYREVYFDTYPGLWHNGELVRITPRGGAILHEHSQRASKRAAVKQDSDVLHT